MFKYKNKDAKENLLYILVFIFMFLVISAWLFFLNKSISYEKSKAKELKELHGIDANIKHTLNNIKNEFSGLKEIKKESNLEDSKRFENEANNFKENFVKNVNDLEDKKQ